MPNLAALQNHQVRLASRPIGEPTRDNWSFTTEPVAEPDEGGVLIKTLYLSLDPAMRGWMNDAKSYIPPVGINEVMRAGGIGEVVASKNPTFAVGDLVNAGLGVQEYCLVPADQIKRSGIFKIDTRVGSPTLGKFYIRKGFERPSTMGNFNNEGFTVTPQSSCVAGFKPVFYSDDNNDLTHSIRRDSIPCGAFL